MHLGKHFGQVIENNSFSFPFGAPYFGFMWLFLNIICLFAAMCYPVQDVDAVQCLCLVPTAFVSIVWNMRDSQKNSNLQFIYERNAVSTSCTRSHIATSMQKILFNKN